MPFLIPLVPSFNATRSVSTLSNPPTPPRAAATAATIIDDSVKDSVVPPCAKPSKRSTVLSVLTGLGGSRGSAAPAAGASMRSVRFDGVGLDVAELEQLLGQVQQGQRRHEELMQEAREQHDQVVAALKAARERALVGV